MPDVAERGDGIAEEHRAEPADGQIESLGREPVVLRVGVFERDVVHPLRLGERTGLLDHLLRDVDAERPSIAGEAGGITRGLSRPAADIQHSVFGTDLVGVPQRVVVQTKLGIVVKVCHVAVALRAPI